MENSTPSPTNAVERKVISFYWRAPAPPQLSQRKRLTYQTWKSKLPNTSGVLISHQSRGDFSELWGGRGNMNGDGWLLLTHFTGTAQSLLATTALGHAATKTAFEALWFCECRFFTSKKRGNVHLEEFHSQGGKRVRRAQCKENLPFLTCPGARHLYRYWTLCLAQEHTEVS